jgi:hypothetical protein
MPNCARSSLAATAIAMKPNSELNSEGASPQELLEERAMLIARLKQLDTAIELNHRARNVLGVKIIGVAGQGRLNLPPSFLNLGFFP